MAADGAVHYHGRRDDLLTTGGFRVSPLEIEAAFHSAPNVEDCGAAAITVKSDTQILALGYAGMAERDALEALAERNLARYKRPRQYIRLDALPRSANGKLDRPALARLLQEAL